MTISKEDYDYLRYFEGVEVTGIGWNAKTDLKLNEFMGKGWCILMPVPGHHDEVHVTAEGVQVMRAYVQAEKSSTGSEKIVDTAGGVR